VTALPGVCSVVVLSTDGRCDVTRDTSFYETTPAPTPNVLDRLLSQLHNGVPMRWIALLR
jgi:hypothetical protein